MSSLLQIVYAATTSTCTFLLDGQGVCRRVVMRVDGARPEAIARSCLGAQYVASLSLVFGQGLIERPAPGAHLLFARTENGRVSLVKTAELEYFETYDEDDACCVVADIEDDETGNERAEPWGEPLESLFEESGFDLSGGYGGHEEDEIETDPLGRDFRHGSALMTCAPEIEHLAPRTTRGHAAFQAPDPNLARRYQALLDRAVSAEDSPKSSYRQMPRVPILGAIPKRMAALGRS